jgi:glycosyltransferase involved in cell wall biosynthesis
MPELSVGVVVPVLNEAENVRELYSRTATVLDDNGYDWEMIYVDDGCKDDTSLELHDFNCPFKAYRHYFG